jgi:hypothetical protein
MNLVDLGDDELIAIFKRVDHKTKLTLMLTCKRFENVIGNYLELFGKFVLNSCKYMNAESPDHVQTLQQMRRHFGTIELFGYDLRLDTEAYNLFFQMLKTIGSKLVELIIPGGKICFTSLVNLLKLTPNISKLKIGMDITTRSDSNAQFKLEKLRRFEFDCSSNIEIFEKIVKPNSLYEIKIFRPKVLLARKNALSTDYWTVIPSILSKQEKLVSLKMVGCTIMDFPDSPEIWALKNLQKLSLESLKFPAQKEIENFTKFIKSLDKLTELNLRRLEYESDDEAGVYIEESEDEDESDYEGIFEDPTDFADLLSHLLFLPTLTKLTFNYFNWNQTEKIFNLKMQNPSVEDLTMNEITDGDTDQYGQYMKIFPNVRKASVFFVGKRTRNENSGEYVVDPHADLTPLNSWSLLEELEVQDFNIRMLYQINMKTLRSFKIDYDYDNEPEPWHYFCLNHPQLERFEVGGCMFKSLPTVVENLPNLKSLILSTLYNLSEKNAIKIIGENCANLEYLEIKLEKMKAEIAAVAVLKEKLPGLRGSIKQIDQRSYRTSKIVEL